MKKTLEESKFLIRKYIEENPKSSLVFLSEVDFINLLNDGAIDGGLNDERKDVDTGEITYRQSAIYEGIRIETDTKHKISDSSEYNL